MNETGPSGHGSELAVSRVRRTRGFRNLVASGLCGALLAGCAAIGTQSTAIPGTSWQEREALRFQQEGDDLGDRVEEAEEKSGKKAARVVWWVAGVVIAALVVLDEDDEEEMLTFDAGRRDRQDVEDRFLRYKARVEY